MKILVGAALVLSAACSPQTPDHHLAISPAHQPTPSAICSHTIDANRWPAGDLCDTLTAQHGIWERANTLNGWIHIRGFDCWNTRATTADPYILCWDGAIKKV